MIRALFGKNEHGINPKWRESMCVAVVFSPGAAPEIRIGWFRLRAKAKKGGAPSLRQLRAFFRGASFACAKAARAALLVRLGAGDPAATALCCGLISAACAAALPKLELHAAPDFGHMQLRGALLLQLGPISLLRAAIRIWKGMRSS